MADPTKERCAIEHKATRRPRGNKTTCRRIRSVGPNFQRDRAGPQKFCLTWGRNPDVCERVGYAGQRAIPFDPDERDYEDLLESVKGRGAVYRPTP